SSAEGAERRTHEGRNENISRRLPNASEPGRFDQDVLHGEGIERSDRTIGREGHKQLARRHSDGGFGRDVRGKSSQNENPPLPWRRYKQGAKQDDVRGPERRKNSVR